jgi:uncharacterized membrane protein (DUF373 family)
VARPALLSDQQFRQLVHGIERQLAKWLGLMLVLVLLVATIQLTWVAANDLIHPRKDWLGGSLIEFLDQLLLILIGLELLQTVTAYLRDQSVQIELVIVTALTALSRKLIIHPPSSSTDAGQLLMVALAVGCLSGSYWLVRQSHRGHQPGRRGPATPSPADHPSPAADGGGGEQSPASHRH